MVHNFLKVQNGDYEKSPTQVPVTYEPSLLKQSRMLRSSYSSRGNVPHTRFARCSVTSPGELPGISTSRVSLQPVVLHLGFP